MNDEVVPLGDVMRLVVDPEPDPRFGPENVLGRDRLEFALYARLQSVAAGTDALERVAALARAGADRLSRKTTAEFRTSEEYEDLACIILATALKSTAGEGQFGYRWRVVLRERVDHDALAVEVAASRARVNRWLAT
jgi:hypothetical protein